jgi:hypothetical protein
LQNIFWNDLGKDHIKYRAGKGTNDPCTKNDGVDTNGDRMIS